MGPDFPKMATSRERQLLNILKRFAFNVPPSQQATFTPVFPGGPPRTGVMFDPHYYRDFALPWDPVNMKVCVGLLRVGSPFPQSLGAPVHKPHWSSMPDPQAWGLIVGLRTLIPVGESL